MTRWSKIRGKLVELGQRKTITFPLIALLLSMLPVVPYKLRVELITTFGGAEEIIQWNTPLIFALPLLDMVVSPVSAWRAVKQDNLIAWLVALVVIAGVAYILSWALSAVLKRKCHSFCQRTSNE